MNGDRAALIRRIEDFPARLTALIAPLSAEELTRRGPADPWSVAQVVHHCADSHVNSYVRCKLIATERLPTLKPYDEGAWAQLPDANEADLAATLALLGGLHRRWARFFRALPEGAWERAGEHPEVGTVTLHDQLVTYVRHGEDHLAQIEAILADR